MSESPHFSDNEDSIPEAPHRIRDWIPYLCALSQDPRCHAEAASIVAEKSGHKRESLLRGLEQYAPVSLRGHLNRALSPLAEKQVVALCEINALADTQLGFVDVKEAIERMVQREVSEHVVRDFLKRNSCSLEYKPFKMLSSSRVTSNIVAETERFITTLIKLVESNRMLKFNLMTCDETVV